MEEGKRGWDDSLISLGLGALVVVVSGILLYNFFSNTSQDLLRDISTSMQTSREEEQLTESSFAPAEIVPTDTPIPLAQIQTEGQGELVAPVVSPSPVVEPSSSVVVAQASLNPTVAPAVTPSAEPKLAETTVVNETTTSFEGTVKDTYTVQKGDSLWKIAEKFYGDGFKWREIAKANNITEPSKIEKGLALSVPRAGQTSSASTSVSDAGQETGSDTNDQPTIVGVGGGAAAGVADGQNAEQGNREGEYVVQKGENLSTIAKKSCGKESTWVKIAKENNLINPRVIHAGNTLRISCD